MVSFFQFCLTPLLRKIFLLPSFPPGQECYAIYMINHNDIFVQVMKGESVGKLISLVMKNACSEPVTKEEGAKE